MSAFAISLLRLLDISVSPEPSSTVLSAFQLCPALRKCGWRSISGFVIAVAEYVDWYNHRRLHGELDHTTRRIRGHFLASSPAQHYPDDDVLIKAGTN